MVEIVFEMFMSVLFYVASYSVINELDSNSIIIAATLSAIGTAWAVAALVTLIVRVIGKYK